MLIRKRNNAAEDTRGKTANCESGIIRARDPLLTLFLSHSFVFSSFLTYFLPPFSSISFLSSLYSFSLLHFFVRLSYPSSDRFLSLSLSLYLSVLFLLSLLRFDVVSWGQCLLDRILSRNTHWRKRTIVARLRTRARATHATTYLPNRTKRKIFFDPDEKAVLVRVVIRTSRNVWKIVDFIMWIRWRFDDIDGV